MAGHCLPETVSFSVLLLLPPRPSRKASGHEREILFVQFFFHFFAIYFGFTFGLGVIRQCIYILRVSYVHMRVVGQRQRQGTVTIEVTGQKDSLCIRYTGQIEIIISTIGVNIEINTGG